MAHKHLYSGTADHPVYADILTAQTGLKRFPIVMLHGSFHNGSVYLGTPDGRVGWAPFFTQCDRDVYVMDWPGHGRSPSSAEFTQLSMVDVGRSLGTLLHEIGPAILFAHSDAGPVAWWVAENFRELVVAVVGIAPGSPANIVPVFPVELATDLNSKDAGYAIYAPTDRPAFVDHAFIRKYWANSPRFPQQAFSAYTRSIGPESPRILNERFNLGGNGLQLEDLDMLTWLPMLVVTGDHDPLHSKETQGKLARFLNADFMWLPDLGITGNGHMPMIEDNNAQIAAHINNWLEDQSL